MDKRVIPNFSVSVDLVMNHSDDAVSVPLESVFHEGPKAFAFVRNPTGWESANWNWGCQTTWRWPSLPGCAKAKWSQRNFLRVLSCRRRSL